MKKSFEEFQESSWGLEIRLGEGIIFRSRKAGIAGLLEFIEKFGRVHEGTVIYDKIVGQGAAMLAAYIEAAEVWGKTGSKLAAEKLQKFGIKFHFSKTVPNILNKQKKDICALEKLSFEKSPEEFYRCLVEE